MTVHKTVFFLINIILGLAILAGMLWGGWFILNLNLDTKDVEIRTQLTRLQASAQLYYARIQSYGGVCTDIGVPPGYSCSESDSAYSIEMSLGAGRFYCLDSSGFLGKTRISKGNSTACRP